MVGRRRRIRLLDPVFLSFYQRPSNNNNSKSGTGGGRRCEGGQASSPKSKFNIRWREKERELLLFPIFRSILQLSFFFFCNYYSTHFNRIFINDPGIN